jgi:hypothetical protein
VAGSDSPNLELCRKYTAKLKRAEYLVKRGLLARVDDLTAEATAFAAAIREGVERIENETDREVMRRTLRDHLELIEREHELAFEPDDEDKAILEEDEAEHRAELTGSVDGQADWPAKAS